LCFLPSCLSVASSEISGSSFRLLTDIGLTKDLK
jgi:hypothetical protein